MFRSLLQRELIFSNCLFKTDKDLSKKHLLMNSILQSSEDDPTNQYKLINLLKKDCSVYLTINICPRLGLFNSAVGTVKELWCEQSTKSIVQSFDEWKINGYRNEIPIIWVDFPSYRGKPFLLDNPQWVPIFSVSTKIDRQLSVKYIPLRVSYGRTTHKIQGSSIKNKVVITTRNYFSTGMCYVALSRSSCIENCRFIGKWEIDTLNMNKSNGRHKMAFFMHSEWKRQLLEALKRVKTSFEKVVLAELGEKEDFIDNFILQELEKYNL